jgi:hypothetical protein
LLVVSRMAVVIFGFLNEFGCFRPVQVRSGI